MQAHDRAADGRAHQLHLVLAPLVNGELDQPRPQAKRLRRRRAAILELDSLGQRSQGLLARLALQFRLVDLLHLVARMRQPVGQIAVVGEKKRPGRVGVEPSHRYHPRLTRHQLDDSGPTLRISRGRHHTRGLVQQQIGELLLHDRLSVHFDAIASGDEGVELPGLAVHRYATILDQLVGAAPRGNTGTGEIGVQAHALRILALSVFARD